MKVLHVITGFGIGGAEKLVYEIVKGSKFNSTICVLYNPIDLIDIHTKTDVKIIHLDKKNKWNPFIIIDIYKVIKKLKPDVVHTHLIHATLYTRIAAFCANSPAVLTTEHNNSNWRKKYFLILFFYRLTAKINRKVFAVSRDVKEKMINIGKIDNKIIDVLYHGIDIDQIITSLKDEKNALEIYTKPIIGTVGRLDIRKGHKYLIEATKILLNDFPDITVLIIGDGDQKIELEKQIQTLNLEKHVHLLGFYHKPLHLVKDFDIFIFPSIEEGLPIAPLEAMALGIPVIATNVGGIPEVIQNHINGILIDAKDVKGLARSIQFLLNDNKMKSELAENAYRNVQKYFSIQKTVSLLDKYYNEYRNE